LSIMGANHGPATSIGRRSTVWQSQSFLAPRKALSCRGNPLFNVPNTNSKDMARRHAPSGTFDNSATGRALHATTLLPAR
jgi:hypothetical protein